MPRFAIEHLPKSIASYQAMPLDHLEAQAWLTAGPVTSLIRTTELIDAIRTGLGVELQQADTPMTLAPGDQALLVCLSFGVMLAWSQGEIPPLADDWRCLLLRVEDSAVAEPSTLKEALPEDLTDPVA